MTTSSITTLPRRGAPRLLAVTGEDDAPDVCRRYRGDAFVARYAAVWAYGVADPDRTSEPYYQRLLEVCLPRDGLAPASILDVGCGPGRVISDLAERVPDARCSAVDAAPLMVDIARAVVHGSRDGGLTVDAGDFGFAPARIPGRGRPDIDISCRRLEDLSSGPRHDLVVASHLLDRVDSPTKCLAALADLVAPGGSLVVACAFNYEARRHWTTMADGWQLAGEVEDLGLQVESLDDRVRYAERLDLRGTITEHVVAILRARRPPGHPRFSR